MNINKVYTKLRTYCMQYKGFLNIGSQTLGVVQSIRDKRYFDAVRIGIDTIERTGNTDIYPWSVFNDETGWDDLFNKYEHKVHDIFMEILSKYVVQTMKLYYETKLYHLPNNIQIVSYTRSGWMGEDNYILYNTREATKEQVVAALLEELFKVLDSNYIQIYKDTHTHKISIMPVVLKEYPSELATNLQNYISKAIELKMPRALLLCGIPGCGKSAAVSTILHNLKLRTLIIKDFNQIGSDALMIIIKLLNIEAILIDDLDHSNITENSLILNFFEKVRDNVKLILATVNSIKQFHQAMIRPGRFDKIIIANKLDDNVIKKLLGEDLLEYFDKVKEWPIAYVNEFVLSMQLESKSNAEFIIKDLQKRVSSNIVDLDLETFMREKVIIIEDPSKLNGAAKITS